MQDPHDPASMTPEERTREVASILATGYLRLRAPGGAPLSPRSPQKDLEEPGDQAPPWVPGERPGDGPPERRSA
jgi:hypothetical protein